MRSPLRHRHIAADGLSIHVVEGGRARDPAALFLHGWPEDWSAFERVMIGLVEEMHTVAIDLPGIGASKDSPRAFDKRTLARHVRSIIGVLDLREVTLIGHDAGGMIAYSLLHARPGELARVVIMNTAIPGVDPWEDVRRNPHIWHFAFHAVPGLPERLVTDHVADYFDFFYDALSASPQGVSEEARHRYAQAYSRPDALRTGFEWYRAFPQDEKDNVGVKGQPVPIPVLYLRGEKDPGLELERYVKGLAESGLEDVRGAVIANSGHFSPDEQPESVVAALRTFMGLEHARS